MSEWIRTNEYGYKCEKCSEWVSPYEGMDFFGITICIKCHHVIYEKFIKFIKNEFIKEQNEKT